MLKLILEDLYCLGSDGGRRSYMECVVLRILAATLVLALFSFPTRAQPPTDVMIDPDIAAWFHTLRNPTTGAFCCDVSDGHILGTADWREGPNGPEVRINGSWRSIPPKAVLRRSDNPTGSAVAFWSNNGSPFYCFVYPSGT